MICTEHHCDRALTRAVCHVCGYRFPIGGAGAGCCATPDLHVHCVEHSCERCDPLLESVERLVWDTHVLITAEGAYIEREWQQRLLTIVERQDAVRVVLDAPPSHMSLAYHVALTAAEDALDDLAETIAIGLNPTMRAEIEAARREAGINDDIDIERGAAVTQDRGGAGGSSSGGVTGRGGDRG